MAKKQGRKTNSDKKINSGNTMGNGKKKSDRIVNVSPKNDSQRKLLEIIEKNIVTVCAGVPGSGKSHISVAYAIQELMGNRTNRVILTRPYVEAGERLGFLPGSSEEKIAPFMMPMYEIISSYLDNEDIQELVDKKKLIHIPFAYMRGITFKNSIVIADEMQNSTTKQAHLLLTRIGDNSKVIINGDVHQSDLRYQKNGLLHVIRKLRPKKIDNIGFCYLGYEAVVRSPIVNDIDAAFRCDFCSDIEGTNIEKCFDDPEEEMSFRDFIRGNTSDVSSSDDI